MTKSPPASRASSPSDFPDGQAANESPTGLAALRTLFQRMVSAIGAQNLGLILGLVLLVIIFGNLRPNFFLVSNLFNILQAISILGIVAIAQTIVMITGGLDISVGSIAALSSVAAAIALREFSGDQSIGVIVGLGVGLFAGLLAGLVNGLLVTLTGISSVIVTLGTLTIFSGTAFLLTNGVGVPILNSAFTAIGSDTLVGIPYPVLIFAMVAVGFYIVLRFTDIGRNVYAIGGNETAARLAGVRVNRYRIAVFALTGLVAGVAGVVLAARISSGQAGSGTQDLALSSIAAVLLGGTALSGGKGTILGTILGVLVLGVLNNGLLLLNVSAYWQLIAQGSVLVAVVVLQLKPWSKESRDSRR